MRLTRLHLVTMLAGALVVSSCASRVETQLKLPPAADRKVEAEPAFPEAALEPCADSRAIPCAAEQAERNWWNEVLVWGRGHRDKVARICLWSRELKRDVPAEYCEKK